MVNHEFRLFQVGNVIISPDVVTEFFCCDLSKCQGRCCIEGESGAPLAEDEIAQMEAVLPTIESELSEKARAVIESQGVADIDRDGDLVTSIVDGRDCIFTCYENGLCLCASERAFRQGRTAWCKPRSCSLYPIREKRLSGGLVGLNLHRWDVCEPARQKGRQLGIRAYQFLREPLIARFGKKWYEELEETITELHKNRVL